MTASLLVLVPISLLILIGTFCFVGCALHTGGLGGEPTPPPPYTNYSKGDVIADGAIAFWPLNEPSSTADNPVASAKAADIVGGHTGFYFHKGNAPTLFPCPGFPIAAGVDTAPEIGELTLGAVSLLKGDAVQPGNDPNVLSTGMEVAGAFLRVPVDSELNRAPPFTVECWVRPEWSAAAGAAYRMVIDSRNDTGSAFSGFCIDVNEAGNWEAELGVTGASGFVTVTGGPAALSQVAYVVLTVDMTNTATLFINGDVASQMPLGGTYAPNTVSDLVIGAGLPWLPDRTTGGTDTSFPLLPFNGTIQDVAIYDSVLSNQTIMDHFTHGNGGHTDTDPGAG